MGLLPTLCVRRPGMTMDRGWRPLSGRNGERRDQPVVAWLKFGVNGRPMA